MASTYTANSGIELIASGEQSGTWGTTTNTNLSIIDRLVNGVGVISLAGTTHTLTTSDGVLSDGQYAVLVFVGAPSGTNTVTISPNDGQHVYIVKNSSGESVILTQGSGGDVTVANGDTKVVYSDGTGAGAAVVDITADFAMSSVKITGGSITGITDLAVADGGTGASDASTARTNLGLAIGTNVQAYDAELTAIAGLAVTDGNIIVGNGTTWVAESGATARTSLGLAIGTNVQAYDAGLQSISGLTTSADQMIYTTALDTYATTSLTAAGRAILDDADASAQRTTLGLAIGTNVQAYDAELTAIAGLAVTDGNIIVGNGTTWVAESGATARTSLGLGTGDSPTFTAVTAGQVDVTAQGDVRFQDTTGGEYVALQGPGTVATSYTLTLPTADGTNGQAVVTNGSGQLSFSDVVTPTGTQTLTNKTLTDPAIIGAILEDIFTITDGAAFEIDPGNGTIQLITLGASRTPKATNFANGESVTLMVDDGSAYTLTWTDATFGGSGVVWKTDGGSAPTLNTTGYTIMVLFKVGGQVYGARVGDA